MNRMLACLISLALIGCGTPEPQSSDAVDSPTSPKVTYDFYRNATARLSYNGQVLLLDPMFSPKHALPSFAGISANPTVDLPVSIDQILENVDAVVVGHLHPDHFDQVAAESIDKSLPIFTPDNQAPIDAFVSITDQRSFKESIESFGFTNVSSIADKARGSIQFGGITITQEFGLHGKGSLSSVMGGVNGIVFQAAGQPTIYWTGDTILDEEGRVAEILARYKPDIVIAHTGGAVVKVLSEDPLLMDEVQAVAFAREALRHNESVKIVAVHMEALDHCFTTREVLRSALADAGLANGSVILPSDGETVVF